ncbi:hypothetical protein ACOSQ3_032000 [Xanthoceras sorbifolium]
MGSKWVWVLGVLVFMFVSLEGCLEEERVALLQLKHFFNDPSMHRDWVEGEKNSDCCQWERVYCNNSTGRVIHLDLRNTRNQDLGGWYLNASLFSTFQELESLELWSNSIIGFAENGGNILFLLYLLRIKLFCLTIFIYFIDNFKEYY